MQKGGLSRSSAAAVHTRHIKGWAPPRAKREDPTFGGAHTPLGRGKNTLRSASRGPPSSLPSPPVCRGEPPTADLGLCKCWGQGAGCGRGLHVLGSPRLSGSGPACASGPPSGLGQDQAAPFSLPTSGAARGAPDDPGGLRVTERLLSCHALQGHPFGTPQTKAPTGD